MKAKQALPIGYEQIFSVNLQKDKKMALLINVVALLIAVVMAIPAALSVPITMLFDMTDGIAVYFLRFGILLAGLIVYILLHEAVHGIAMKLFGAKKVKYGFTGLYAFAGSEDYFDKKSYIIIALAPVIIWGAVLTIINYFVSAEWFWVVYFIQMSNISGAVGDLYVTAKFCRMPKEILVHDSGVEMTVFASTSNIEEKSGE